ncbi:MAG: TonB-dependent receptor [Proteobacteria bacterium]|nr:TonB-dependent receptor [Pseudomonadota bacterium]
MLAAPGLVIVLAAGSLAAQPSPSLPLAPANDQQMSAPSSTSASQATLHVLVFLGNEPLAGARLALQDARATTTDDGSARLAAPAGPHSLFVRIPSALSAGTERSAGILELKDLRLAPGEVTQLILTLDRQGRLISSDLESPRRPHETPEQAHALGQTRAGPRGTLRGRIVSSKNAEPVADASVYVRGVPVQAKSGPQGRFALSLPEATYSLSIIHADFGTSSMDEVRVVGNQETALEIRLDPAAVQLEDFVVTAPHIKGGIAELVQERREASAVADVIGSEQMARTGDSNAAAALRRVTGITVIDGKFIYVRGMGERYSSTLLNGAQLPSPEPTRRVVPLDMFPTGVIESVVIQKTYSPDRPAEFGGGVVQLRSRGAPERFKLSLTTSLRANTQTTFRNGWGYPGGRLDFLGIDDGTRRLPEKLSKATADRRLVSQGRFDPPGTGFTADELQALGRSLDANWQPQRRVIPPGLGLSASVGDSYQLGSQSKAGFLLSLLYGDNYRTLDYRQVRYVFGTEQSIRNDFRFDETRRTINLAAILDGGLTLSEQHRIRATSLLLRTTGDLARTYAGPYGDIDGAFVRATRLRWAERQLSAQQLAGEHTFEALGGLGLAWRAAYNSADRSEPNRRDTRYDEESRSKQGERVYLLANANENNPRLYADLDDTMYDVALDLTLPIQTRAGLEAQLRAGGSYVRRERSSDVRRFRLVGMPRDESLRGLPPNQLFAASNIGPDGFVLKEATQPTDHYTGRQRINAAYVMGELSLAAGIDVMAGARLELAGQRVVTSDPFKVNAEPVVAQLHNNDLLPASTLTWHLNDKLQARLGFSQTLSRPEFRELSSAVFFDSIGRVIVGNPDLKRAKLWNFDARVECYFSGDESVSVGGFYKRFDNPIEETVVPAADQQFTYANALGATNLGLELELIKRFGMLMDELEHLYLALNLTLIRSRIELDPELLSLATNLKRPLQGQSPYVANVQLGYDDAGDDGSGLTIALLYNVSGPRIRQVGANPLPDIVEQPLHSVDLIVSKRLGRGFVVRTKAQNLLNPVRRQTQGGQTALAGRLGARLSVGLAWSY